MILVRSDKSLYDKNCITASTRNPCASSIHRKLVRKRRGRKVGARLSAGAGDRYRRREKKRHTSSVLAVPPSIIDTHTSWLRNITNCGRADTSILIRAVSNETYRAIAQPPYSRLRSFWTCASLSRFPIAAVRLQRSTFPWNER